MDNQFEAVWTKIFRQLHPGTVVRNWGAARGYTGHTFEVREIERTSIIVAGGNMRMPGRISKGDFEKVYTVWAAYIGGNYPRSKMTNVSQNSTYILSILHSVCLA